MSNLIEKIVAMDEGGGNDALILQPVDKTGNGAPNYGMADGLIRRIRTQGGWQWAFHTIHQMGRPVTGSGFYGDINEVVAAAERQFGIKSDVREWIGVDYCDPDFPINFIP